MHASPHDVSCRCRALMVQASPCQRTWLNSFLQTLLHARQHLCSPGVLALGAICRRGPTAHCAAHRAREPRLVCGPSIRCGLRHAQVGDMVLLACTPRLPAQPSGMAAPCCDRVCNTAAPTLHTSAACCGTSICAALRRPAPMQQAHPAAPPGGLWRQRDRGRSSAPGGPDWPAALVPGPGGWCWACSIAGLETVGVPLWGLPLCSVGSRCTRQLLRGHKKRVGLNTRVMPAAKQVGGCVQSGMSTFPCPSPTVGGLGP